jgi:hypothetical protein
MTEFLRAHPPIPGATVLETDFVTWALQQPQSIAYCISNPPYLRFHDYDTGLVDTVNAHLGTDLSKLTNLFSLFLLAGANLIRDGGRLVCIIPTEIFTTNYGKKTLTCLPPNVHLVEVHVFRPDNEPFQAACTTSCIVVLDRGAPPKSIRILEVEGQAGQELTGRWVENLPTAELHANPKRVVNGVLHRDLAGFVSLGDLFHISRGLSTGNNDFFLLTAAGRQRIDPDATCVRPCIKNAANVKTLYYEVSDHVASLAAGKRHWLLRAVEPCADTVAAYLRHGEAVGVPSGHVCSHRNPWFRQENHAPGVLLIGAMYRDHCKVVGNPDKVSTLACFHRILPKSGVELTGDHLLLLNAWLNTKAGQDSIRLVSRRYGSGMFKIEPSDAHNIMVPDIRKASPLPDDVRIRIRAALRACDTACLESLLQPPLSAGCHTSIP